jgi:hypothetical protein
MRRRAGRPAASTRCDGQAKFAPASIDVKLALVARRAPAAAAGALFVCDAAMQQNITIGEPASYRHGGGALDRPLLDRLIFRKNDRLDHDQANI